VIYWPLFLPVLTFETASVAHKWHLRKTQPVPAMTTLRMGEGYGTLFPGIPRHPLPLIAHPLRADRMLKTPGLSGALCDPPELTRFVCRDAPSQAHELCAGDGSRWVICPRQLVSHKLSPTIRPTVADAI
jgi:hypothetical protein